MKNKEKYLEEIMEAFVNGTSCVLKRKIFTNHKCYIINCEKCATKTKEWLEQEYEEPIILTRNEKAILESLDSMFKWITRDSAGCLLSVHADKPTKEYDCWKHILGRSHGLVIYKHLFQFIKWEDSEPYNIKELLGKCEVIEND